jgi:sporulation protein YlmC with PRC-barrel domain
MKLTNKQQAFINFYLVSWNASDAARRAGYAHAGSQGERLLRNVEVQQAIREKMAENAMQADEVLQRLGDQARFNLTDLFLEKTRCIYDKDGNQVGEIQTFELDWEKLKERGHLIKSLTNTQWGPKIEAYDGQAALFKIGTALGALTERVDLTSKGEKLDVVVYIPDNGRGDAGTDDQTG